VIGVTAVINDVKGTITPIEPIFDEGKKHAVLIILVREKP
jgi:hypothetical protein